MRGHSGTALAVECEDLVVEYDGLRAVDGVSFKVQPGEIFGLLGPNAAGKTSVIRALSTIIKPAGGRATIAGCSLDEPLRLLRHIGALPESNGYPSAQTALRYLRFYGRLFGLDTATAEARGELLLEQLGLSDARHQRIGTFSRGMRQRLGICRALVNEPTVLFLDEPTLGLDPAGKEEVLGHLAWLASYEGSSVLLCSHLLDEVERVCDRVAILHEGRIVAGGTVDEVVSIAAVDGTARVRVAQDHLHDALNVLERSPLVGQVAADPLRLGEIEVQTNGATNEANDIVAPLLDAGIGIRSVELQGARLSDAFFALTEGTEVPS